MAKTRILVFQHVGRPVHAVTWCAPAASLPVLTLPARVVWETWTLVTDPHATRAAAEGAAPPRRGATIRRALERSSAPFANSWGCTMPIKALCFGGNHSEWMDEIAADSMRIPSLPRGLYVTFYPAPNGCVVAEYEPRELDRPQIVHQVDYGHSRVNSYRIAS